MLWAPVVPSRPQLLKQDITRLAFASLAQGAMVMFSSHEL